MERPAEEIEAVIRRLTQSARDVQRRTIIECFTPDAQFIHPFCRVDHFDGSRLFVEAIYRWYKIMSPRIDLTVHSIAYDEKNLILYVNISQVFRIWIVPFYSAPVDLTTVLRLAYNADNQKYYIRSQNDLYQTDQFIKFAFPGGYIFIWLWQWIATLLCAVGTLICTPLIKVFE